jgi:uncharacterized protein YyaL (SSP411 family)
MVKTAFSQARDHPFGFGYWLAMADLMGQTAQQIALITNQPLKTVEPFLKFYRSKYRPGSVVAARYKGTDEIKDLPGLLGNRKTIDELPTAYVCLGHTCQIPTNDIILFKQQLDSKNRPFP